MNFLKNCIYSPCVVLHCHETAAEYIPNNKHIMNQHHNITYPLVISHNNYWKLPFIVDLPTEHGDFP